MERVQCLAAEVVSRVLAGRSLDAELAATWHSESALTAQERGAVQDLSYGVLRHLGFLEAILGQLLHRPPTDALVRNLLQVTLYQLLHSKAQPYTIVDHAVPACAQLGFPLAQGLVNAVLRNFLRRRESLLAVAAADDEAAQQHPRWWLAKLRRAYPQDWQRIVDVGNSQPPMTLRVNQRRLAPTEYLARLEAAGHPARRLGGSALQLHQPVSVDALPGFFDGLVSVQDAGAQHAVELLDPATGAHVLDACAAPGGKTAHLLERADLDLLALDIDGGRTRRIEENLQRLGLGATVRVADCCAVDQWWDGRLFDAILADVPCSASGVVRRHPDIKCLRREGDIRRFAQAQTAILDALWPLLKPGGKLLYATCSVFPEENGAQIDAFLVRKENAERLRTEQLLPQEEHDGFYYALLRKAV
ncbi:MAG: 16S rRNA (cytosine(967)-C(5))-methyltransferase RsmB [Burkholderiales bacterium]